MELQNTVSVATPSVLEEPWHYTWQEYTVMSFRKWDAGHLTRSSLTYTHRSVTLPLVFPHTWGLRASSSTSRGPSAANTRTLVTHDDTHASLVGAAHGSAGWAPFTDALRRSRWRRLARTSGFQEQNAVPNQN